MNKIEQFKMYGRRTFNPSNKSDLKLVKSYLHNSRWDNGCPFILEWPYLDIPSMIKDKITTHTLGGLK